MQIERRCRITGVERAAHLVASHSKPWRDSSNEERLDGENGLLLTPSVDHPFYRGFIGFEDSGVDLLPTGRHLVHVPDPQGCWLLSDDGHTGVIISSMRGHIWIGMALVGAGLCAQAQWLNQPMVGAPRTPDGKVNMTGPVPRLNGKPDLSGIWQVQAEPRGPGLFGLGESPNSKYFRDILSDFKPDERPLTPAGAEILRKHGQLGAFNPTLNCLPDGVPHGDLLPEPFKIIQTPGVIVMLYEVETTFRQIFMDGRKQPADPSPTWQGY